MARFSIFRTPKAKKFEYLPRYWDPEKEELEARLSRFKGKAHEDKEIIKTRISSGFRAKYSPEMRSRSRAIRQSNTIRMAIFVILLLIAVIYLSEKIPKFVQLFDGSGGTI